MGERNYTEIMKCSIETKEKIMIACKDDFLDHHPEFNSVKISQGFMLKTLADYYLKN